MGVGEVVERGWGGCRMVWLGRCGWCMASRFVGGSGWRARSKNPGELPGTSRWGSGFENNSLDLKVKHRDLIIKRQN